MKKIRVAVIGYGHIGKYVVKALDEAGDLELVGIVEQKKSLNEFKKNILRKTRVVLRDHL